MLEYRPTFIDVSRLCERLSQRTRRPTTDVEAQVWLRRSGFVPYGDQWVADADSIIRLESLLSTEAAPAQ